MPTATDSIEGRIAANLRQQREALGLSLAQLADRSGVSKAMVAKVESGAASPTAGLLGRLCAGLGVTLSSLMMAAESADVGFFPSSTQPTWRDPETGLDRTLVAPSSSRGHVEIARLALPAGASVDYDKVPARPVRQHIIGIAGRLFFTIGGDTTSIGPGDCLFAVIDRPTRLESAGPDVARYYVIQETA
ncbi:MAG TPA: XRE family transcriptional regulator [Gemmatimonadales bacterium]|nr:XRE family transcriptional regulator [Gemmatimonadales bacterium]